MAHFCRLPRGLLRLSLHRGLRQFLAERVGRLDRALSSTNTFMPYTNRPSLTLVIPAKAGTQYRKNEAALRHSL